MPAKNLPEYRENYYKKNTGKYLFYSRKARLKRRARYNEFMADKRCVRCGETETACLDWHHIDPSEKDQGVSVILASRSWDMVLKEIKKCVCLCANCHRKFHAGVIDSNWGSLAVPVVFGSRSP